MASYQKIIADKRKRRNPLRKVVDALLYITKSGCQWRKRHIVVDTLGLLMTVVVHAANVHDSVAAKGVFKTLKDKFLSEILKIFADGGYKGKPLREWAAEHCGWDVEIVKRNEANKFKVLPKRWIVERTFA